MPSCGSWKVEILRSREKERRSSYQFGRKIEMKEDGTQETPSR
jgi:hypothetical protein